MVKKMDNKKDAHRKFTSRDECVFVLQSSGIDFRKELRKRNTLIAFAQLFWAFALQFFAHAAEVGVFYVKAGSNEPQRNALADAWILPQKITVALQHVLVR